MPSLKLLVLNDPTSRYLKLVAKLPDWLDIVAGDSVEAFADHTAGADVVFIGLNQSDISLRVWPLARRVRWVHSFSAGAVPSGGNVDLETLATF